MGVPVSTLSSTSTTLLATSSAGTSIGTPLSVATTTSPGSPASTKTTSTAVATSAAVATSTAALSAQVLNSTNYWRTLYQANPVAWNTTLSDYATTYGSECLWAHSGGPYGENLALGFSTASAGIDAWAAEGKLYNFSNPTFSSATGHFTQLVWQDTTQIGCALIACANTASGGANGKYLVCEYSKQRGNILGQFATEVKPQKSGSKRGLVVDDVEVEEEGIVMGW